MKVSFLADKCQVNHNGAGENTKVILHTGSHELGHVKELLLIPNEELMKITIEWGDV